MQLKAVIAGFFIILFSACAKNTETPGNLVPPTADQDPNLPSLTITVAGHRRMIHLQTFGSPANPPVFVLHGGPGADFRLLLPLKSLADQYYVVMWDSRGAGLSERVTREELSLESFDEEISAIRSALAPGRKLILIGHSFGGNIMAHFAAGHPEATERLILIEPGKLDLSLSPESDGGAIGFIDGQDFFWQNELLTSRDHAVADYKGIEVLPKSTRNWTCDHSIIAEYPMWRFGAYHYYIVQKNVRRLPADFNWVQGIADYAGPIAVIASTCGALSENFQRETNLKTLPRADIRVVAGANHLSLFTDFADATLEAIRNSLHG